MVRCPIVVRFADTDAMGVVYHANYLVYFELARGAWLIHHGLSRNAFAEHGLFVPAVECHCRWRSPAKYGDPLVAEVRVQDFSPARVTFAYRVLHEDDGRVLCEGDTTHAFVDFGGRPVALPRRVPELYARLQAVAAAEVAAGGFPD